MVVDPSALVAIYLGEPERNAFIAAINVTPRAKLSAVSRVELVSVLCGGRIGATPAQVAAFVASLGLEAVAVTVDQMEVAMHALLIFGKGRHPAKLNLGNCFSYALARTLGDTLLFKGDDFARTDVAPAWRPEAATIVSDDLFPGFSSHWIDTAGGRIFARAGGGGPPLVLLHGFPQTHAMWHRIAPALAESHRVVCMDLRGYGWSSAPAGPGGGAGYAKSVMARDVVDVMEALGHVRFAVGGHDRGGRVAYRLALDEPGRVERLALLDILPTAEVWRRIEAGLQPAAHWDFLAGPEPEPEREIGRDSLPYFEGLMRTWSGAKSLEAFDPRALHLYRQSCNEPTRIHAFCEDYRAGRTIDREQDHADLAADRILGCPAYLVWSARYLAKPGQESPLDAWRRTFSPAMQGVEVPCGHFVAEEAPAETLAALRGFLGR